MLARRSQNQGQRAVTRLGTVEVGGPRKYVAVRSKGNVCRLLEVLKVLSHEGGLLVKRYQRFPHKSPRRIGHVELKG